MTINLAPLQSAYIKQAIDVDNNIWMVFSEQDEKLSTLPNTLNPKEAMSYLHFARKFEIDALNKGIAFGIKETADKHEALFQDLKEQNLFLQQQNEILSTKLEKFIIGEEG